MTTTEKKKAGRPAGSLNTGGNIVERMNSKIEDTIEFLNKLSERVTSWSTKEEDEKSKDYLVTLAATITELSDDMKRTVSTAFKSLVEDEWKPSVATSSGSIDYSADRQVWIKPDKMPTYLEFGFTEKDLGNLIVVNVVKGKVVVSAKGNAKVRFPVPKIDLTVTDPSEVEAE